VTVFRPSARVRLQLRIDELDETAGLEAALAKAPEGPTFGRVLPATKAGAQDALRSNFQRRVTVVPSKS